MKALLDEGTVDVGNRSKMLELKTALEKQLSVLSQLDNDILNMMNESEEAKDEEIKKSDNIYQGWNQDPFYESRRPVS